jgi:hypothetical protein
MTVHPVLWLAALLLAASCAMPQRDVPPQIMPVADSVIMPPPCASLFPAGRWQFVHTIAFRTDQGEGTALGVVVLSETEIRCALMTVEGLTLFEARAAGEAAPEVIRAIPPFDRPGFATGLMRDIRLIFRPPPGKAEAGRLADGGPICRFATAGTVTDILPREDGCWSIHAYTGRTRTRTIQARACRPIASAAIPGRLELTAGEPDGYSLTMELVSAERLPAGD